MTVQPDTSSVHDDHETNKYKMFLNTIEGLTNMNSEEMIRRIPILKAQYEKLDEEDQRKTNVYLAKCRDNDSEDEKNKKKCRIVDYAVNGKVYDNDSNTRIIYTVSQAITEMTDDKFKDNLHRLQTLYRTAENNISPDEKLSQLLSLTDSWNLGQKYIERVELIINDLHYNETKEIIRIIKHLPVHDLYNLAFVSTEMIKEFFKLKCSVTYKSFYKSFGNTVFNYITDYCKPNDCDCPICLENAFRPRNGYSENDITVQQVSQGLQGLVFEPNFYHFSCAIKTMITQNCNSSMTRRRIVGIIGIKPLMLKPINTSEPEPIDLILIVGADQPPTFKNDVKKTWLTVLAKRVAATMAAEKARARVRDMVSARQKLAAMWNEKLVHHKAKRREQKKRLDHGEENSDDQRRKAAAIARKNARLGIMPDTSKIQPQPSLAHPPSSPLFRNGKVHPLDALGKPSAGVSRNQVAPIPGGRKASSRRLESRSVEELKAIAKTRKVNVKGLKKQEIIDKLRRRKN